MRFVRESKAAAVLHTAGGYGVSGPAAAHSALLASLLGAGGCHWTSSFRLPEI